MTFSSRNNYLFLTVLIFTLFFNGCAPKTAMLQVDTLMANGNYRDAAEHADSNIDKNNPYAVDNLLWNLEGGSALLFDQNNSASIELFDDSESLMKYYREQVLMSDITQTVTSTLINDTMRPYIGSEYDGIMSNTYKAINYMALGDMQAARVEFNRAIDRQRRAKVNFAQMIDKERQILKHKEAEERAEGKHIYASESEDSLITSRLEQGYPSLHAFKPYPDFINPMTTYLSGVFAMADGNYNKAHTLLKESYGMMSDNVNVESDFKEIESILDNRKKTKEPRVWVIFENGQAPILKEWRIDLPVFIVSNNLNYISVALPRLVERQKAFEYLSIEINKSEHINTAFLCSMDRVIKTEFEKEYENIVRRAILSVATKTGIQYALKQEGNNQNSVGAFLGLAATIYQIATTQADTRIWSTLPKEFHLARFSRPDDGKVKIMTPQGVMVSELKLPESDYILIYVKMATSNAVASVSVIPFARR